MVTYDLQAGICVCMANGQGPDLRQLGRAVSELRRAKGLSQRALAAAAGVSRPHVRNVEEASGSPGLVVVVKIAGALGVTVDDLLRAAGWLPGPDLAEDLASVYEDLSVEDREVLLNIGRVLQEAHRGVGGVGLEPIAAYDREEPPLE